MARSVRFRIGHPKSKSRTLLNPDDNKFVWTYTSPEFPMMQDLKTFNLPEAVLCHNGYVQIELLGRVQRQETGGLFNTRMNCVGRPLFPTFDAEIQEATGEILLRYYPAFLGMQDTILHSKLLYEERLRKKFDIEQDKILRE